MKEGGAVGVFEAGTRRGAGQPGLWDGGGKEGLDRCASLTPPTPTPCEPGRE